MSNPGAFKLLVSQQSKASDWLNASQHLSVRLAHLEPSGTVVNISNHFAVPVYKHFKPHIAISNSYIRSPVIGNGASPGSQVKFQVITDGDFVGDMALHVKFDQQTVTVGSGGVNPTYRWCEYPGERLIKRAEFRTLGKTLLDDYTYRDSVIQRNHHISEEDMPAYKRSVGQEESYENEFQQATGVAPTGSRIGGTYRNGFQTPKTQHGQLEMFIPLHFWFCEDYRSPFPSFMAPVDRTVELELAPEAELVGFEVRGNSVIGESTLSTLRISECELWQNHIYVNEEIKPLLARTFRINLIRVHRRQDLSVTQPKKLLKMSHLKWATEHLYVALQPTANESTSSTDVYGTSTGINHLDHWHYMGNVARQSVANNPLTCLVNQRNDSITSLSVNGETIEFYKEVSPLFYNSYLAYQHKGINTNKDIGSMLVPFNRALEDSPTGHINISHVRNFHIEYDSTGATTPISALNPATAVVHAQALNFLEIKQGTPYLKFST